MRHQLVAIALFLAVPFFSTSPARATDETAADLVARGRLHLSAITDAIDKKYKGEREKFWDINSIAYHDFTGVPEVDVIVGLAGYQDKGGIYNGGKQVVEDAGAAFAYFHKEKDEWTLKQVELVKGMKYVGFEGANLIDLAQDQLVVYSANGTEKYATIFMVSSDHLLKKVAIIEGKDFGPRVSRGDTKATLVNFRKALIKDCDDCQIYFGQAYIWKDHRFVADGDDFLDAVETYSKQGIDADAQQKGLAWFENYLNSHPKSFAALANCYDLSVALSNTDKAAQYKKDLLKLKTDATLNQAYCDSWLADKNKAFEEQYLDDLEGIEKAKVANDN